MFEKRLEELAARSYERGVYVFTEFLGLGEQSIFARIEPRLRYAGCTLWGGDEDCERLMLRFGDAESIGYEQPFPIVCIAAAPAAPKFADALSHRDILGALMNLGIRRECLGDIVLQDNTAYIFCTEGQKQTVQNELVQARHTVLKCAEVAGLPAAREKRVAPLTLQVSSERADVLIAAAWSKSREESLACFRAQRVFVNGRLTENNSAPLHGNDLVSVRGEGRFRYLGVQSVSRKGKYNVLIEKFI